MKDEEISKLLGDKIKGFSEKGRNFLRSRSNGRDKELSCQVINDLASGKIAKIPQTVRKEAGRAFDKGTLSDSEIVIILLGRPPVTSTKEKGVQESGKIWPKKGEQADASVLLADKMKMEHTFKNVYRDPNAKKAEKPKPAEKAKTAKAEKAKPATKAKAQTTAKTKTPPAKKGADIRKGRRPAKAAAKAS